MRRWFCVALVVLAPVAIVGSGSPAVSAAATSASGTIVFSSTRDGDYEIYAVNPDGTGLTQLTHNDVEDSIPLPSPDGKLIAFFSDEAGQAVMNADGSGRRPMRGCGLFPQSWAPDSARLVCEARGGDGLAIADAADGAVTPLTPRGHDAAWSPDGRTIAFVDEQLWAVPAAGGTPRLLARRAVDGRATWSPDSRRLAYPASVGLRDDLFTINADGSGERRLAKSIDPYESLHWSPQGSLIVFQKGDALYTVRPDGTGLRRVAVLAREASWSADGATLLYSRGRHSASPATDVFVTRPGAEPGRGVTRPFPDGGTNGEPRWMPGPPLSTAPRPLPRTVRVSPTRSLTFPGPDSLAVDGNRAVLYDGSCGRVLVWEPLARRTTRTPALCPDEGDWHRGDLVLAGRRLASIMGRGSASGDHYALSTLRLGARRPSVVIHALEWNDHSKGSAAIGYLRGRGGTIAFTSYDFLGRSETRRGWLLVPRGGGRCPWKDPDGDATSSSVCRRLAGADGGVVAAVDGGRVVVVAPSGIVRLLSEAGAVLRQWTVGSGIVDVALRGRALAVQRGASLALYDTATGAKTRTRALVADEGPPVLLDLQGGLVAYTTGGAIHVLRLSDGRDRALALPRSAPPLDARFAPRGLVVQWYRMGARRPGRLWLVPLRTIARP